MNISPTLKANAKTTKVVEPCVSTLNHPAEFAQSAAVFCAAPGNHRFDAALAKPLTMRLGVVPGTTCIGRVHRSSWQGARRPRGWPQAPKTQAARIPGGRPLRSAAHSATLRTKVSIATRTRCRNTHAAMVTTNSISCTRPKNGESIQNDYSNCE